MSDARADWLARRKELITASDVAAILGRDPRRGPFTVWAEKCGFIEPEETPWMRRGRRLEAAVAEEYAEETGRSVGETDPFEIRIHPDIPWLGATLDRTTAGNELHPAPSDGSGPLELKAVAAMKAKDWRENPPEHFQIQLQVQMACTGSQWGSLAALIGGLSLAWVDLARHHRLIAAMIPRLEEFRWRVTNRTAPDADDRPATAAILKAMYAEEDGETIVLDSFTETVADDWERAKAAKREAEKKERLCANVLRLRLGSASFGKLPDGTYLATKTVDRSAYEVEETTYRQLRRFQPRLLGRRA